VDAASGEWALAIDGLSHDPSGRALRKRDIDLLEEERKRVAYVAVTRARDLLVVPEAGAPKDTTIPGQLLRSTASQVSRRINPYRGDGPAWWNTEAGVSIQPMVPIREDLDDAWSRAARAALEPVLVPAGVSTVTHAVHVDEADDPDPMPRKDRTGRYGAVFGSTVHRALELVLTKCAPDAAQAVQWAAREVGLEEHLPQAEADVTRTLAALESAGLLRGQLELEYPIAGSLEPSTLLGGYIDLLVATEEELVVIDFKTDEPPAGDARKRYPGYVAQVGVYAKLLEMAGVAENRRLRQGLLFTGDGGLRWVG
jgi:ATP-dependent helicase/nuclease subunit A